MEEIPVGEIVETQAAHEIEPVGRAPVKLGEQVAGVLGFRAVAELVGHQIVPHEVAAEHEVVALAEAVGVQGAHIVLHIAVLAHVAASGDHVVALVILVESIAQSEVVAFGEVVFRLERAAEVAVVVLDVRRRVALTEIIAGLAGDLQPVKRPVDQLLLDIVVPAAVDFGIVAVVLQGDGVALDILGVGEAGKSPRPEAGGNRTYLLAQGAVARVHADRPGFRRLPGDDVHDSANGVGAVE